MNVRLLEYEFTILSTLNTKSLNISGKRGTIVKQVDNDCYVNVEGDIYRLRRSELSEEPVPTSKVNMGEILKSDLFKDLIIERGEVNLNSLLRGYEELKVRSGINMVIKYIKLIVGSVELLITGEFVALFTNGKLRNINNPIDSCMASALFEKMTGKNVWHVMKTLSLFEYELCSCGHNNQTIIEPEDNIDLFEIRMYMVLCSSCRNPIYSSSHILDYYPEASIQKIFLNNNLSIQ